MLQLFSLQEIKIRVDCPHKSGLFRHSIPSQAKKKENWIENWPPSNYNSECSALNWLFDRDRNSNRTRFFMTYPFFPPLNPKIGLVSAKILPLNWLNLGVFSQIGLNISLFFTFHGLFWSLLSFRYRVTRSAFVVESQHSFGSFCNYFTRNGISWID